MRKFAWMFMAATTVAGFTACSNVEDEPLLPGIGGGGNGGTTPSVVITDTIYTFDNIEAQYTPINELCPGWTHEIVSPSDDDRTWQSGIYQSEKYIQATAHDGKGSNAGKTYDLWMFTPALNVKDAPNKVFSFYSEGAFWKNTSSLEVYVLNEPKSTASAKELLSNVRIATEADGQYKWIASGDISLEGKGDTVYVAFRYQGQGGASNSTTYRIDDFAFGRAQVAKGGGDLPDPLPDPSTVMLTDTIYTFDNIANPNQAINTWCAGWVHEVVSPAGDNGYAWESKTFQEEKYVAASVHDSSDGNAGKTYELWMITPALNVKDAPNKVFSFYSEYAYWTESTKLEVYVLNEQTANASQKELLTANVANPTNSPYADETYHGWVASGDISLEGKGDIVYIGFRYQAQGGKSNSTTYCIDDFAFGRKQVEHAVDGGGDTPDPTPDVDWSGAVSVADALLLNDETVTVKGYIVGTLAKGCPTSFTDVAAAAEHVEMQDAGEYTGYSTVIIADNADETDLTKCLWVKTNDDKTEFPGAAGMTTDISLDKHPENIGKVLYVKGTKRAMFSGLPGVRGIEGWKLGE